MCVRTVGMLLSFCSLSVSVNLRRGHRDALQKILKLKFLLKLEFVALEISKVQH